MTPTAVVNNVTRYADTLGTKAAHGYSGFCRQDFIGADYGMLDCSTGSPLPDYFLAVVYEKTMGKRVLRTSSSDPEVRAYSHCFGVGAASLMVINLKDKPVSINSPMKGPTRLEYHLTALGGNLNSTAVALNGKELSLKNGLLPPILPGFDQNTPTITLEPRSVTFVQYSRANMTQCNQP